jgi:hypothetical protein
VNLNSSSDPELERRIFSQVHSAGRQLGHLAAVVQLLLDAREADPSFAQSGEAQARIEAFRAVQADIAREKKRRDPERLIERLENLKTTDPTTFTAIRERLCKWLDSGA